MAREAATSRQQQGHQASAPVQPRHAGLTQEQVLDLKSSKLDSSSAEEVQATLGYGFTDERLLQLALRHKSAGGATNNGALVRLGATLLPLLTASDEYAANPNASRKDLHETRRANSFGTKEWKAALAERLGLPSYIHCVKPAKDPIPVGMKADAYLATLAAIFVDSGHSLAAVRVVYRGSIGLRSSSELLPYVKPSIAAITATPTGPSTAKSEPINKLSSGLKMPSKRKAEATPVKQCTASKRNRDRGEVLEGIGAAVWQPVVADRQGGSGRDTTISKAHDNPSFHDIMSDDESELSV